MTYPSIAWLKHPGRNRRYSGGGWRYHNRSRWQPHQGKREKARRLRQQKQ